jgi:hypothetical protein
MVLTMTMALTYYSVQLITEVKKFYDAGPNFYFFNEKIILTKISIWGQSHKTFLFKLSQSFVS